MKRHFTTYEYLAPKQPVNAFSSGDINDPEKLIHTARRYFAIGFPNKRRRGCPMFGVILAARADRPPGADIREHLFRCSECFNEYSAAIGNHYRQSGSGIATENRRTKLMDALWKWRMPLCASATAFLLLTANLFIQQRKQTAAPQSSYTRSQPAPVASAVFPLTPAPPAPTARRTPRSEIEKPRHTKSLAINLDLNRYKDLGDAAHSGSMREEERKIELPPRQAILNLRLREGSNSGRYRISVVDPDSNRLIETTSHSRNGKSLSAFLDLRRAASTAHRLRLERGDVLNEYLIVIAKP